MMRTKGIFGMFGEKCFLFSVIGTVGLSPTFLLTFFGFFDFLSKEIQIKN
jgi:hypothetical protein